MYIQQLQSDAAEDVQERHKYCETKRFFLFVLGLLHGFWYLIVDGVVRCLACLQFKMPGIPLRSCKES